MTSDPQHMDPDVCYEAVLHARRCAAKSLASALRTAAGHFTELSLHRAWIEQINLTKEFAPVGWYLPPPSGYSLLIGTPPDYDRLNFVSLRSEPRWPRDDIDF